MNARRILLVVLCCCWGVAACGKKVVTRVGSDEVIDLSGRWNDTDSRLVSDEMIADCLTGRWLGSWHDKGKRPTVIVGRVRNKSTEHIAISTFIGDIERALVNGGDVTLVASAEEREQVREERTDQQQFSSDETMKQWGRERGADYILTGVISSITDREDKESVIFYQVDLTLIHLENNTRAWQGQKKIKKYVGRGKYKP